MRIKVTIEDIIVEIDRPDFVDYSSIEPSQGQDLRVNIMNDSILPLLEEAISAAKELYKEKSKNGIE